MMPAKKILIIEDNQDMAQLLALYLRDLQHNVELCFEGDSGYHQVKNNQYDLVILDLMLPGKNGLSICQAIRENQHYTAILMLYFELSRMRISIG